MLDLTSLGYIGISFHLCLDHARGPFPSDYLLLSHACYIIRASIILMDSNIVPEQYVMATWHFLHSWNSFLHTLMKLNASVQQKNTSTSYPEFQGMLSGWKLCYRWVYLHLLWLLGTNPMETSSLWDADSGLATQRNFLGGCGIWSFITLCTRACHWIPSRARWIQSTHTHALFLQDPLQYSNSVGEGLCFLVHSPCPFLLFKLWSYHDYIWCNTVSWQLLVQLSSA